MKISRSGPPFDLDEFLSRPLFAHLATGSSDGPRESPVWFLWEDGAVWLIANSATSFPQRIVSEPRCAFGFVDFDRSRGFLQHVGMRGDAVVQPLNKERLYGLLGRYLGEDQTAWNSSFREAVIDRLDLIIRFTPCSIVMRGSVLFQVAA